MLDDEITDSSILGEQVVQITLSDVLAYSTHIHTSCHFPFSFFAFWRTPCFVTSATLQHTLCGTIR
jgi:hypothetical protein